MKITISDITSLPEFISIRRSEYVELKSKARRYDERRAKEQQHLKNINNSRSSEQRKLIAKKAAAARWSKNERN